MRHGSTKRCINYIKYLRGQLSIELKASVKDHWLVVTSEAEDKVFFYSVRREFFHSDVIKKAC